MIVTQFPKPAGAIMVTALGRTLLDGWHEPRATVSVDASASFGWRNASIALRAAKSGNTAAHGAVHGAAATVGGDGVVGAAAGNAGGNAGNSVALAPPLPPIALVGRFDSVRIVLPASAFATITAVYGADLASAADSRRDITSQVVLDRATHSILVPGRVIDAVGTLAKSSAGIDQNIFNVLFCLHCPS